MSNKNTIFGFCNAGCKYPTMHKEDILKMAKWGLVENNGTDGSYDLTYNKNYRIIDTNKFDYDNPNSGGNTWNLKAIVNIVCTYGGKNYSGSLDLKNSLPTFNQYIGELTIQVLDTHPYFDQNGVHWGFNVVVKINDSVKILLISDIGIDPSVTDSLEVDFATVPLTITGAKEVYVEGDGTLPVSYTYDFDTLTDVTDVLDDDYFVITRNDGNTYKVSALTLKNYVNGTIEPDAASSAVVGEGEVGSMTIE